MIRNAFGSDENGQLNGLPNIPNKIFMEEVLSALFSFPLNRFSFFRFVVLIIVFVNCLEFKNWRIFFFVIIFFGGEEKETSPGASLSVRFMIFFLSNL